MLSPRSHSSRSEEEARREPGKSMSTHRTGRLLSAQRHRRLSFFGSVLREDSAPRATSTCSSSSPPMPGLASLSSLICSATSGGLLGRDVDLHTPASLSHFFREGVVDSAEVAYAA